jgi:hypothetical protein
MFNSVFNEAQSFIEQGKMYANQAIDRAMQDVDRAITISDNAQLLPFSSSITSSNYSTNNFIVTPFTKNDIPQIDNNFLIAKKYLDEWIAKFNLIMNSYFKNILSFNMGEKAIQDILTYGYIIKQSISNQIISRAMDTESSKLKTNNEKITLEFLSKGYTIPNFMLLNRLDQANQQYNEAVSQINRDLAIKLQELQTDMTKFSIDKALDLLPKCVQIASQFSSQYAQIFSYGVESAKAYIQGLAAVNDSIRIYEDTVLDLSKVQIEHIEKDRRYDLDNKSKQAEFNLQKIELNTKTTIAGVEALTRIGTAGLQAQQSIINLTAAGVQTFAG